MKILTLIIVIAVALFVLIGMWVAKPSEFTGPIGSTGSTGVAPIGATGMTGFIPRIE